MPSSYNLQDAAEGQRSHILKLYRLFAIKKPIMLMDLQEQRIYAYPYTEFRSELSEKSQRLLKEQYERALRDHQVVLFVRDNELNRLVSFSVAEE